MATKYTLDIGNEYDEELSTSAVTLWTTNYPAYTFAYHLNELFDLKLSYDEPLEIIVDGREATLPLYLYQDAIHKLNYILVENSTLDINAQGQRSFSQYDKTLIINGFEAKERMEQLRADLTDRNREKQDLFDMRREARRIEIMDNGIIESASMDFSDPGNPILDTLVQPQSGKKSHRLQRYLNNQTQFIRDVFMAVDYRLSYFEDIDSHYSTGYGI